MQTEGTTQVVKSETTLTVLDWKKFESKGKQSVMTFKNFWKINYRNYK